MDYIVADATVIPDQQRPFFTEKVVHLPDSYQANDRTRAIADRTFTRDELGLPPDGVVFCCFNNQYKITPPVFDVWMRLVAQVPGSVLWLLGGNPTVESNLSAAAQGRGVDPRRLVFAPRLAYAEHLARYRLADIFLDTLPFNAGTTASDALWAGLPVVTCAGRALAARMAGSLLHAVGLQELIAESSAQYEAIAVRLAVDAGYRSAVRRTLASNRDRCPLFDTDRFRRDVETAYATMWAIHCRGETPRGFAVPAEGAGVRWPERGAEAGAEEED
jgi:predicted O-linked N-acetylglucosamine transferase (SPINDLY family)